MIGYQEESGSRVYRVYDETTSQVLTTWNIVFDETTTPKTGLQEEEVAGIRIVGKQVLEDLPLQETMLEGHEDQGQVPSLSKEEEDDSGLAEPVPPIDPDEGERRVQIYDHESITVRPLAVQGNLQPEKETTVRTALDWAPRPQRTWPVREMFPPAAWQAFMAMAEEPSTLQEALEGKDAATWRAAWESEMDSLQKNQTWVIENTPLDRNRVGCRWLLKRKEDGRFKVRLVA